MLQKQKFTKLHRQIGRQIDIYLLTYLLTVTQLSISTSSIFKQLIFVNDVTRVVVSVSTSRSRAFTSRAHPWM